MTGSLETITALQEALDELNSAETQLGGVPDWMGELHEEHSAAKAEIDELDEAVEGARQERRAAEAVVADSQQKLKQFQEQISLVRNQREYGALLQEIDVVKDLIRRSEEEGLAALQRQEEAEKPLSEKRDAFAELDERYREALERWETEKPEVSAQAENLKQRIDELRQQLNRNLLLQFDRIRERYSGQALAPVVGIDRGRLPKIWHCSACNYSVRPQAVMQILNDRSVVLCDSCKRILYLPDEATS